MKQSLHSFFSTRLLIGSIALLLLIGSVPYFYSIAKTLASNNTQVAHGIQVGDFDIGGMNGEELRDLLEHSYQTRVDQGVAVLFDGTTSLLREQAPLDTDIPIQTQDRLFSYDYEKTIEDVFSTGHSDSLIENAFLRAKLIVAKQHISIAVSVNHEVLNAMLEQAFPGKQHPALPADLIYNKQSKTFTTQPEQSGIVFDSNDAANQLQSGLQQGLAPTITLHTIEQAPPLRASDIEKMVIDAQALVREITLKTDDTHVWKVHASKVASWITITLSNAKQPALSVRTDSIKAYLESTIAPAIFTESKDPRFELQEGKIVIITQPQDGQKLAVEESVNLIQAALLENVSNEIMLPVNHHPSALLSIPNQDSIKEVVGYAETNFKGSPTNRRKNIANGASRINGILIQPQEEFSLLSYLDPIDETTGFLPELVIKGNVTKPEYGGGLCQVSTTLFRAVSYAGLPIIQRRNHSYRVGYYEPPVGFDATIYSPAPDFKFRNDMATPLLIQTSIKGTKISITLWGTKDGRISEVDKPTVYNIRKPPDTKIIETTELEPGKKKCTEKAHAGADAFFERRVTYPSGEVKKETFKSHYIVWPAVCYVGKAKEPENPQSVSEPTSEQQSVPE
ncbi:MAG: VanW family protein [Patescibacteria group bacterium]